MLWDHLGLKPKCLCRAPHGFYQNGRGVPLSSTAWSEGWIQNTGTFFVAPKATQLLLNNYVSLQSNSSLAFTKYLHIHDFIWSQEPALEGGIAGYYHRFISEEPETQKHWIIFPGYMINKQENLCFWPQNLCFPIDIILHSLLEMAGQ